MKRFAATALAALFMFIATMGCAAQPPFQDGVYRAEYADYDTWGYRQYLVVTVVDSKVTQIEFDAINAEGTLRSTDEDYQAQMETVQGTYPQRYSSDLINQYLEQQDIEKVDAVAGATEASNQFTALFRALDTNMRSGDTTTVVI